MATTLERRLGAAVRQGDAATLQQLHEQHPFLIEEHSSRLPRTVLHAAVMLRHAALVAKVLELTPRLARTTDSDKSSPLHIAAEEGLVEICQRLLSIAPETCWWKDRDGMTPLHVAAREGRVEICRELLSADPGVCWSIDSKGRNPLYVACMKGHVQILELLLRTFPLLAAISLPHGETLLHLCVKHGRFEMLKFLVEMLGEENLHATDGKGETVMSLAIKFNGVEVIAYSNLLTSFELVS